MEISVLLQALREFTTGLLNQLLVNLTGQDGPEWLKEFKKFLRKEPCWTEGKVLSQPTFGKLETIQVVEDGKTMNGHDYIKTARSLAKKAGKKTLGDEAFNFYKLKENWHLLPEDVNYIVFPEAQFDSGDFRHVRVLIRDGAEWLESAAGSTTTFLSDDRAGVSQE